jgi:hypothetical protein
MIWKLSEVHILKMFFSFISPTAHIPLLWEVLTHQLAGNCLGTKKYLYMYTNPDSHPSVSTGQKLLLIVTFFFETGTSKNQLEILESKAKCRLWRTPPNEPVFEDSGQRPEIKSRLVTLIDRYELLLTVFIYVSFPWRRHIFPFCLWSLNIQSSWPKKM